MVLTQDLLAYLGRPILRNNHLPLRACSDKTSHPVAHLVGVHLVRSVSSLRIRCHELISSRCKHHWPEAIYIRANHPTTAGGWRWRRLWFVWVPATTEPPKPRSTGYHWTLRESTRVWTGEYCPDGATTTGWMYVIIQLYYLIITNAQHSIWQHSGPTAQHRIVWQFWRKRSVWEHPAANAAASWSTARLRPVRQQVDRPNNWGRNVRQQLFQPNGYDLCSPTNQPFRKHLWTVGFSAGEQHIWRCNWPLRSPVCTCSRCNDIQHTTSWKFHVR